MKAYLVFADCDGTILDEAYRFDGALPGISSCRESGFDLILASSKTRSELNVLQAEIGLPFPFIFENGGGIHWNRGLHEEGEGVEYCGLPAADLAGFLEEIGKLAGCSFVTMKDLGTAGVMELTGLGDTEAARAMAREVSLPFIVKGSPSRLADPEIGTFLASAGLDIIAGKRFYYLMSNNVNKGSAVKKVVEDYRARGYTVTSMAAGDGENDLSMFGEVDYPFLVRSLDGGAMKINDSPFMVTRGIGPGGFNEAVALFKERIA